MTQTTFFYVWVSFFFTRSGQVFFFFPSHVGQVFFFLLCVGQVFFFLPLSGSSFFFYKNFLLPPLKSNGASLSAFLTFFNFIILPWKTTKRMQNSTTFDKIFLPQFTKSITFWLHVSANVKRTEFIIYNSIPIIQYIVFFKANLSGKCLFISTSPVRQCRSLWSPCYDLVCMTHTTKTGKMENP